MSTKPKDQTRVSACKVSSLRAVLLTLMFFAISILSACGGGSTNSTNTPNNPTPVSVSISPATTSVDQGATLQFSASVTGGGNQAVTWSVQEGAAAGSITPAGLYKAPASAMGVHVVATSAADPSKSSSALVTVNVVSVSLPATAKVHPGQTRQFKAAVAGTVVKDVNWTLEEGSAGGGITSDGLYTAPMSGGPFHVTARSVADPSKAATALVVVADAGFRTLNTSTLQPRISHTATLLPNGKVLIVGGNKCDSSGCSGPRLSSAELFDPATETFTATGSMSFARNSHTATLLNNGTVLVTGGNGNPAAEVYDPVTGVFTKVGNMTDISTNLGDQPGSRLGHTASLLMDGRVLIAGGEAEDLNGFGPVALGTAEIYDPATRSFSRVGDLPDEVLFHTASVLLDGRVLVAGGNDNFGPEMSPSVAVFDATSKSFSASVSLPSGRAYHTATTLNDGRVLITGGITNWDYPTPPLISDTALVFDPATSGYSSELTMREPRYGHSATLLLDGKVLVVGTLAELFDPGTSSFVITADPNVPREDRRATRLADGRVLFTGSTAVAEIYE